MIIPEGRRVPAHLLCRQHHTARQIRRQPVLQDRLARLAPHDPCPRITNNGDIAQMEQRHLRFCRIPHASGGNDDLIAFLNRFLDHFARIVGNRHIIMQERAIEIDSDHTNRHRKSPFMNARFKVQG